MPAIVGSFVPLRSNFIIPFLRVGVSVFPKEAFSALVVSVFKSSQKTLKWLTVNPSMPGLEAPFMTLNRQCVSSSVVSIPSMEFASLLGIFLLSSSSNGAVSPSEHKKSVSALADVSRFDCNL